MYNLCLKNVVLLLQYNHNSSVWGTNSQAACFSLDSNAVRMHHAALTQTQFIKPLSSLVQVNATADACCKVTYISWKSSAIVVIL